MKYYYVSYVSAARRPQNLMNVFSFFVTIIDPVNICNYFLANNKIVVRNIISFQEITKEQYYNMAEIKRVEKLQQLK